MIIVAAMEEVREAYLSIIKPGFPQASGKSWKTWKITKKFHALKNHGIRNNLNNGKIMEFEKKLENGKITELCEIN